MFDLVKQQVNLLKVLEKDLGVTFRSAGEKNWKIDGDKDIESCPFCGHHECFRVKYEEGDDASSFYKCFSCGESGDVISWTAKKRSITPGEAAKELAREIGLKLPSSYNPIQQIFTLAAQYYHNCLVEICDRPYPVLNGLTPMRYQTEVRKHKKETIEKYKIGYSDGGLVDYLESVGVDQELIEKSGLANKKGKDLLPANTFIYPHFVGNQKGLVSHFTFKDPLKRIQYQVPKRYSLNGYVFYGQDTFSSDAPTMLVEGENDWLSIMESGVCSSGLAMIGQISGEQLDWLKTHGKGKRFITLFDPDDAGDNYRKKVEGIRKYLGGLIHVLPPAGKDIDELLVNGAKLTEIIKCNLVEVKLEEDKPLSEADSLWEEVSALAPAPAADPTPVVDAKITKEPIEQQPKVLEKDMPEGTHVSGHAPVVVENNDNNDTENGEVNPRDNVPARFQEGVDNGVDGENGHVLQKRGCYYKSIKNKDNVSTEVRISNFVIQMLNIYEDDQDEKFREIVVIRSDGYKSKPFLVNSETKVTSKLFKILVAKYADCEWLGKESELDAVWRIVYNSFPDVTIAVSSQVGRHEKYNCWLFRNLMISGSGVVSEPDESGVFWPTGKSRGIKLDPISNGDIEDCVPELRTELKREETEKLLGEALFGITQILKEPGAALMAVGWIQSCIYSNEIFKYNGGMGLLMFWGQAGKGKSTIAKWLQRFFGLKEKMASTAVQQLRSAIGFLRKAEYYSSIPMFLDELRADELSNNYLGMIRSWYDREGRTMADLNDVKKIRNQKIRATLMIGGEDLPADPATKERCIMIRVPPVDTKSDENRKNYDKMEFISEDFSNITYYWIIDSCFANKNQLLKDIREIDGKLVAQGCSNRISKVWAGAAYFANEMAKKYFPEYDFMKYLTETTLLEHIQQKSDNTLAQFLDSVETLQARENTPLTDEHIGQDPRTPNWINIWYSAVFKEVSDMRKGSQQFSKHAILRSIREEPYFVSEDRKVNMGVVQRRRTVLTLNLDLCPDSIKNLVDYK